MKTFVRTPFNSVNKTVEDNISKYFLAMQFLLLPTEYIYIHYINLNRNWFMTHTVLNKHKVRSVIHIYSEIMKTI